MTTLPLLARIRVATPCQADWAEMTGDERVRHCAHCKKDVFNLSEMAREQAERLIIERNGDLCARYYQRKDGTILLADCSVGIKQKRKTRVLAAGAAALLAGTAGTAGYLKLRHHDTMVTTVQTSNEIQGGISIDPREEPAEQAKLKELEAKQAELERRVEATQAHVKLGKLKLAP